MAGKILTILGDATHEHDLLYAALSAIVGERMPGYELDDIPEGELKAALEGDPSVVVLSKMNSVRLETGETVPWMTGDIEDSIVRYVERGGGWFVWHSGLAFYPKDGRYVKMLGGHFYHRPPGFLKVKYSSAANTPVIDRTLEFEVTDEHYMVSCGMEKAAVFLNSSSAEGISPAGWCRAFGKGRICCLAAPHPSAGTGMPEFEEILYSCLKWCAAKG